MATERTFLNDGSYLNSVEEGRSWVQLFPADQSKDAGVWVMRYKQDVKTFRSTNFPLTTITHTASAKTLTNPNTGALETFYLVGENITGIEYGCIVNFERIYAPEIGNIETVSSQSISIPDWNGLEESGTYAATIDNRRTAIYTARKQVSGISDLAEVETISSSDIRSTISGVINVNGIESNLTQSVDDILEYIGTGFGVTSVLNSSDKLRVNSSLSTIDSWDISVSGLNYGTAYIIKKTNQTGSSFFEIQFVASRSTVSGYLSLQSTDPGVFYTSNFSAGADNWVALSYCTINGNIDGIGGQNDCLRVTSTDAINQFSLRPSTPLDGM